MRRLLFIFTAIFAGSFLVHDTRAATEEASTLSAYAGNYKGKVLYYGFPGTTTGRFSASKTQEKGALVLHSKIPYSGTTITMTERIEFNGKKVKYSLDLAIPGINASVNGSGRASIAKRVTSFRAPGKEVQSGLSLPVTISGRLTPRANGLRIDDVITIPGQGALPINYTLKK